MRMSKFSLNELENKGFCSVSDIRSNYALSKNVQEDVLELLEHDVLKAKVEEIMQEFAVKEEMIYSIYYSLLMGNLILEGPPGTGKTSLAKAVSSKLFNVRLETVTANTEWTVYDLVGRKTIELQEGKEQIIPEDGHITRVIVECCHAISEYEVNPDKPQAVWLLIDELNRCKIDRAFGEFFTVLAGVEDQPLTLGHQVVQNRNLYIPKRFRIIGTMNSTDKTYVNAFSQAFARRFDFVMVGIPVTPAELALESDISLRASTREVAQILGEDEGKVADLAADEEIAGALQQLEEIVSLVRFGKEGKCSGIVPLGTAQVIDVKKALLLKCFMEGKDDLDRHTDWAVETKLVHQLDNDFLTESEQMNFLHEIPKQLKGTIQHVKSLWGLHGNSEKTVDR